MTAQAAKAGMSAIMGARRNRILFDFAGMITSFISSLNTSAKGCPSPGNSPSRRTRFGPRRSCIQPMTLRSHNVRSATLMISVTVMTRIQNVECA